MKHFLVATVAVYLLLPGGEARRGGGHHGGYHGGRHLVCSDGSRPTCADGSSPSRWRGIDQSELSRLLTNHIAGCADGSRPATCPDGQAPAKMERLPRYRCADGNKTVCSDNSAPQIGKSRGQESSQSTLCSYS